MKIGTELVAQWAVELAELKGLSLTRIAGGASWCALSLRGSQALFCSWSPESSGLCLFPQSRCRSLERGWSQPTALMMALQKHLSGATLLDACQLQNDRLIRLDWRRYVGAGASRIVSLLFELTPPKSNVILTDDQGIIIEAASHVHSDENAYRSVLPGRSWTPPPPMDTLEALPSMTDDELYEALSRPRGFSPFLARQLKKLLEQGENDIVRQALFSKQRHVQRLNQQLTVTGILLPQAQSAETTALVAAQNDVAEALERRSLSNIARSCVKEVQRQQGRRRKHRDDLLALLEASQQRHQWKLAGDAIIQNLHNLDRSTAGQITLTCWTDEGEQPVPVTIDRSVSLQKNADRCFKKYRKLQVDGPRIDAQLTALNNELKDLEALEKNLALLQDPRALRELCDQVLQQYGRPISTKTKKKTSPPHLRFDLKDVMILVGMNERGNRYVTFQEGRPDDLWFHVHDLPGSHAILKGVHHDDEEMERLKKTAASLALYYSASQDLWGDVDCTERKQVHHIAGAGPAQVTYRRSTPLRVHREEWREVLEAPQ